MYWILLKLLLVLVVLAGCNGISSLPGKNDNSTAGNSVSPGITELPSGLHKFYLAQTVEGGVQQREYFVRYPMQPNQSDYPLIFYFHGNGGTAADFYKNLHEVHELIDNNQFIGIFPQGLEKSWNLGEEASRADDVAWVKGILEEISDISFVNSSSVYAVGISNGAGMANKLAKETNSFKGIAPIVSQQTLKLSKIDPLRGVSVFQINGDDDPLIPLQGGFSKVQHQFVSARDSAGNWALHSNCATVPSTFADVWGPYPVEAFVYSNCDSNRQVRYHIVQGSGHNGNFGDFALHTAIWNFFKRFPGGD
jgi:poly(3-hydroxybutyrate) depolymerase